MAKPVKPNFLFAGRKIYKKKILEKFFLKNHVIFFVYLSNISEFDLLRNIFQGNFDFERKFRFLSKIWMIQQNFYFSQKFQFFYRNFDFPLKFRFLAKFRFFTEISIFHQKNQFFSKISIRIRILIFHQNFNFFTKISIFSLNFQRPKLLSKIEILL